MYSLPQRTKSAPSSTSATAHDILYLDEDAHTLERLFRMICGQPILPLTSYDTDIDPLLYAAEKYDMPGPMSLIRALVMTSAIPPDALRLYAIACRYGWTEEAAYSARATLSLDVHAPEHRPALEKLGTHALLDLFALHRTRRDNLRSMLDAPPFVNADDPDVQCSACEQPVDYHTWRELKLVISAEMDVRPSAETILGANFPDWPTARACWAAMCTNTECNRLLYDKTETLRLVRECIEKLPTSI